MNHRILFIWCILFLFLITPVFAFEIRCNWPRGVSLGETIVSNVIVNIDLKVSIVSEVFVELPENKPFTYPNFTVYFNPWELGYQLPAKNLNFTVCEGRYSGANYDELFIECENQTNYTVKEELKIRNCRWKNNICEKNDYKEYRIVIDVSPIPLERWKQYVIKIDYEIPEFILTQGDHEIIWLTFPNIRDDKLGNYIMLPKPTSWLESFPDNAEINRYKDRWVLEISGSDDIMILYTDMKKVESKNMMNDALFMLLGAGIGLFFTIIYPRFTSNRETIRNEEIISLALTGRYERNDLVQIANQNRVRINSRDNKTDIARKIIRKIGTDGTKRLLSDSTRVE